MEVLYSCSVSVIVMLLTFSCVFVSFLFIVGSHFGCFLHRCNGSGGGGGCCCNVFNIRLCVSCVSLIGK
jgi:hypothetical protein